MKKITFVFAILFALNSCVSTNKGFQSSPVVSRNVDLDPIKADIKVNESTKLTGQSKSAYFLFFRVSGDNTSADGINYSTDASSSFVSQLNPLRMLRLAKLNKVRAAAAYNALSTGDYDLLVHPNYVMTTKNFLWLVKVYECSVSGYGAKYENFRTERQKTVIIDGGKEFVFPEKN